MATVEELYDRAVDLYAEGRHPEAVEAYRQALDIDPAFTDALHGLTMAYAELGDLESAISTAKRITEVSPDDALGWTSLSICYQRNG